jgi:Holliday junction resolvase RusA-like endonuclease
MVIEQKMKPTERPVKVSINWYRKRKAGDIDGRFKLILDVLQAKRKYVGSRFGAYVDDAQINELHMYRHEDKKNPRMEIEVEEI